LPLLKHKPVRILVANRTKAKAEKLAIDFAKHGKVCGFGIDQIKAKPVDIVINATSASLSGEMPAILPGVAEGAFCYDLMYGQQTPFMDWAKQSGASGVSDGLGMLVEQAAEAYYFWRGIKPNTNEVLSSLRATNG
jgi:shikimate dehydrogenase